MGTGARGQVDPSLWAGPGLMSISFAWPFILSQHSQPPEAPSCPGERDGVWVPFPAAPHSAPPPEGRIMGGRWGRGLAGTIVRRPGVFAQQHGLLNGHRHPRNAARRGEGLLPGAPLARRLHTCAGGVCRAMRQGVTRCPTPGHRAPGQPPLPAAHGLKKREASCRAGCGPTGGEGPRGALQGPGPWGSTLQTTSDRRRLRGDHACPCGPRPCPALSAKWGAGGRCRQHPRTHSLTPTVPDGSRAALSGTGRGQGGAPGKGHEPRGPSLRGPGKRPLNWRERRLRGQRVCPPLCPSPGT